MLKVKSMLLFRRQRTGLIHIGLSFTVPESKTMLMLRKIGLILAYTVIGVIGSFSIAMTLTILSEIL